ncbi:hypothetical protein [Escherichia phage Es2]|uniref:Uncharacterized protein n=2 Tax=Tequintavirus S131 TaxID=2733989 RepID=A0A2Z5HQX6_9CAUD|nr:hypothetical protein HOT63_gp079 [Salmonella phage S131]AXC41618.1 hypothetical protein [Salmonella phage S130]AXC41768.1 hypothetical protein [Salmonella phage S131]WNL62843.1 hypothetical protein [Escherichia phage Es2]
MKEFGQFKLTQEDLEKMGITQEMLQVFPKSSEIPEGFMRFDEAIEHINNLVKTDPLWREVFEQSVRK